jgi:hypothetical protein
MGRHDAQHDVTLQIIIVEHCYAVSWRQTWSSYIKGDEGASLMKQNA